MHRISIKGTMTLGVVVICVLFILFAWSAGNHFRQAALQSHAESLSRIVEITSNQILQDSRRQAVDLGRTLSESGGLHKAIVAYEAGTKLPLASLLDHTFSTGFSGNERIELAKLRLYTPNLNLLLETQKGSSKLPQQLPDFLLKKITSRKDHKQAGVMGGLWVSGERPLYSVLLAIDQQGHDGYLEIIFDPFPALNEMGAITGIPLHISPLTESATELAKPPHKSGMLAFNYLLIGEDQQPAYHFSGTEDVNKLQREMRNSQFNTSALFFLITIIILILLLLILNRGIFVPLKNLLQGIKYYRSGELDTRITPTGLRELHTLGETFNSMIEQIQYDINQLERYSNLDGLTGLSNRRYFEQRLKEEWSRSTRQQTPIALLFIDIDHFKRYNDHYGHLQGDDCLRRVAVAIKQAVKRDIDVTARYGGEEFVIMLPDTDISGAEQVARELQSAIRRLHIEHSDSNVEPFVTLSIGVASQLPRFPDKADALLKAADVALYQAKGRGRNCIRKFSAGA